jgi:hypothetical protein
VLASKPEELKLAFDLPEVGGLESSGVQICKSAVVHGKSLNYIIVKPTWI